LIGPINPESSLRFTTTKIVCQRKFEFPFVFTTDECFLTKEFKGSETLTKIVVITLFPPKIHHR